MSWCLGPAVRWRGESCAPTHNLVSIDRVILNTDNIKPDNSNDLVDNVDM